MYIATLLCAPTAKNLAPEMVDSLRNAWGGGDVQWLAPDEAAEFSLTTKPQNFWTVWADVQALGVDLFLQPASGRKKQLLLADMDSTIIQQECIDELADEAGFGALVSAITARAMNGELDFEEALTERVLLLKGLKILVIDTVLRDRITLMPGAGHLVSTMRANGAYTALVSGGFTAFTGHVAKKLGFDENRANTLNIADGVLDGTVGLPILGREAKVSALNEIAVGLGISTQQAIAVGDGANDLGMLSLAGAGVALHAKPVVAEECEIRVNFGDLTALLFLQGYSKDEFVG